MRQTESMVNVAISQLTKSAFQQLTQLIRIVVTDGLIELARLRQKPRPE
jgi:hypothetical protein